MQVIRSSAQVLEVTDVKVRSLGVQMSRGLGVNMSRGLGVNISRG
jgi:hypothetical protein